ncbi:GyrI-like domain-containing protein [Ureibacillus acetophenoni]|uniref:GyrI-like small molecule binding protein n=1 Tax=Ureibacillus acetophenoni TaxID=614649 RepID=A0A285UR79_9BACL|nr:GyrI-like domain-containing protein [Ureibacillus acetophenoni]SOC43888.1 GyrI-like small molecule binding protein [Ureibacillus acetophenoni]
MECRLVRKAFKVVGIEGKGYYADFGSEVPKLAQQLQSRLTEVESHTGIEIGIFEPKRDEDHLEGSYFVGVIVNEAPTAVPAGLEFIETAKTYATTRGNINYIGHLHDHLLQWVDEQGYIRDLESHIIETYHSLENGKEDVEIYLPIYS